MGLYNRASHPWCERGSIGFRRPVIEITERKETEEKLRQSEERYRTVVEEQTELICRFLPDKTITFVTKRTAATSE
jgi:PAS domain-containing protein